MKNLLKTITVITQDKEVFNINVEQAKTCRIQKIIYYSPERSNMLMGYNLYYKNILIGTYKTWFAAWKDKRNMIKSIAWKDNNAMFEADGGIWFEVAD